MTLARNLVGKALLTAGTVTQIGCQPGQRHTSPEADPEAVLDHPFQHRFSNPSITGVTMFKSLAAAAMIALSAAFGITVIESATVVATAQAQTGGLEFRFDSEHDCRAFESYQIGQGWHLVKGCHHSPGYNGRAPGWYTILTA